VQGETCDRNPTWHSDAISQAVLPERVATWRHFFAAKATPLSAMSVEPSAAELDASLPSILDRVFKGDL
jgi:hypothetical protein